MLRTYFEAQANLTGYNSKSGHAIEVEVWSLSKATHEIQRVVLTDEAESDVNIKSIKLASLDRNMLKLVLQAHDGLVSEDSGNMRMYPLVSSLGNVLGHLRIKTVPQPASAGKRTATYQVLSGLKLTAAKVQQQTTQLIALLELAALRQMLTRNKRVQPDTAEYHEKFTESSAANVG